MLMKGCPQDPEVKAISEKWNSQGNSKKILIFSPIQVSTLLHSTLIFQKIALAILYFVITCYSLAKFKEYGGDNITFRIGYIYFESIFMAISTVIVSALSIIFRNAQSPKLSLIVCPCLLSLWCY